MVEYPARAQILATTNLCPCGDYTPVKEFKPKGKCRYSLTRCQSYSQRLSGPLVDRFEMIEFTAPLKDFSVSGASIKKRVEAAQKFAAARSSSQICNSRKDLPEILASYKPGVTALLPQSFASHRRKLATLRVARTLADLDISPYVEREHLNEALNWTQTNFEKLKRWDC